MKTLHPHTAMNLGGEEVQVDNELVAVIHAMWDCGIRTTDCCQGSPACERGIRRPGYVAFRREDMRRLLELCGGIESLFSTLFSVELYSKDWRPQDQEEVYVLRFDHSRLGDFVQFMLEHLRA